MKRPRIAWLTTARALLIREGVEAVTIQHLSRTLKVTRGGFYGYFNSRRQLLTELRRDWSFTNTRALRRITARGRSDGAVQFRELIEMWVEDKDYEPAYDAAIRDWGRRDAAVASTVRRVDRERIRLITRIFRNLRFSSAEAHIRARITYYHQVGYYTLDVRESRRTRRRLLPLYASVLAQLPIRTRATAGRNAKS